MPTVSVFAALFDEENRLLLVKQGYGREYWQLPGGMPLGLFKGVRTFTLTPQPNGVTTFTVREEYTGPLVPLMWRSMPNLQPSFDQFATGLKQRAQRMA